MKIYGIILAIALLLRVWGLGLNPVGIVHDEIHDLINAKSLAILGQSAPGTAAGIITSNPYCDGNCIFGELASYLLIPWMMVAPLGLVASKIPFLLASLGIVYFGGKFFENISGKKEVGWLTSGLLAINPWAIYFGRSAFENLFSFALYLWALYLFTKKGAGKKEIIGATVLAFLGFLAYFGAKPVFVFIVAFGIFYFWKHNKFKNLKLGLTLIIMAAGITIGYLLILKNGASGKRFEEITTSKGFDAAFVVNEERRMSLEIPKVRDLLTNKYVATGKYMLDKFLGVFNPIYLFSRGEQGNDIFVIPNQSYLYLVDGVFIVLGLVGFGRMVFWILPLMGAMTIPTIISVSGVTYGLRSGMIFPMFCGLTALGIYWTYQQLAKKWRVVFVIGVAGIYVMSFIYFQVMYWYRSPFEKSGGWFFHERALVKYLALLETESPQKVRVSTENPVDMMYNYAFYTGKYNDKNFADILNRSIRSGNYEIEGIIFVRECPKKIEKNVDYVWEKSMDCVKEPNMLPRISEVKDGGARFFIPEEKLCQGIKLTSYPYPRKIEDFNVEKMDKETFCKMWVSKP